MNIEHYQELLPRNEAATPAFFVTVAPVVRFIGVIGQPHEIYSIHEKNEDEQQTDADRLRFFAFF
ncbi:hypothetical protein SDC9_158236 [bioreactor metagenome]|uniref:Uncharacterized protein n=1 Tax=bioreactor metagenome TaxID=1076179 RepID=A0A645FC69_9ZZZZ